MYAPRPDDEIATLVGYVDQQLAAVRACVLGLTDEQARDTPCRSALSLAGLVKHLAYSLHGWITVLTSEPTSPVLFDPGALAAYQASFTLTPDETATGILATFDGLRSRLVEVVATVDPDTETLEPPAPWSGIFEPRPALRRYLLLHIVEELARHAGHADILREQLDGMSVPALVMTEEGLPANDFFTPYVPAPGTIGA